MAARGRGLFSMYIYIENFKNLLVKNQWTDFNITWQECFFGDPLPRLFKITVMPIQAAVCLWKASLSISFKYAVNKTSRTFESSFSWMTFDKKMFHNVIKTQNFYVTLYQDCSSHHDSSKNMAASRAGLIFPIYLYRKLLKSSHKKQLDRVQCNLAGMLLWWPSTKIVQDFMIRQKTWPPWGRGLFFVYICIENFKNSSCQIPRPISILLGWNVALVNLYQDCSSNCDSLKNMAARGGAYFPYISE